MSITLDVDSFVFDPRPNYPLVVAAKRYRPSNAVDSPDALTLIFAHGTGYHKEQWEPTVLDLLNMARNDLLIREIWSVDCPNHGDSAIVNENTLLWGYEKTCEYIRVLTLRFPTLISPSKLAGQSIPMPCICL